MGQRVYRFGEQFKVIGISLEIEAAVIRQDFQAFKGAFVNYLITPQLEIDPGIGYLRKKVSPVREQINRN